MYFGKLNLYTNSGLNPYAQAYVEEKIKGSDNGKNLFVEALRSYQGENSDGKSIAENFKSIDLSSAAETFDQAADVNAGAYSGLARALAGASRGADNFIKAKAEQDRTNALAQALADNDPNKVSLYDSDTGKNMRDNLTRMIMNEENNAFSAAENAYNRQLQKENQEYDIAKAEAELQYKYDVLQQDAQLRLMQLMASEKSDGTIAGIPEKQFMAMYNDLDSESQAIVALNPEKIFDIQNGGLTKVPGLPIYFGAGKKASVKEKGAFKVYTDKNGNTIKMYADGTVEEF